MSMFNHCKNLNFGYASLFHTPVYFISLSARVKWRANEDQWPSSGKGRDLGFSFLLRIRFFIFCLQSLEREKWQSFKFSQCPATPPFIK